MSDFHKMQEDGCPQCNSTETYLLSGKPPIMICDACGFAGLATAEDLEEMSGNPTP